MREKNDFLTNHRKKEIEDLAEYVANYYCPDTTIDLELIANRLNISFSYGDYGDSFDGLLEHDSGNYHIYINQERLFYANSLRARFTFAHELGHYYIDSHRNALSKGLINSHCSFTGFISNNLMEKEADYFAACLLIPKNKLIQDCLRKEFNISFLKSLCSKYQVSLTSMAIRFAMLGNHPIMIVYALDGKIKWFWQSSDFPFWGIKHNKELIPDNTVMKEYYADGITYESKEDVYAQDWFIIKSDEDYDRLFYEFCAHGSNNSVLSLIWEE